MAHRTIRAFTAALAIATMLLAVATPASAAVTGVTRVSLNGPTTQLSGTSTAPSMSADGRFVVFESDAPGLANGAYSAGGPSIYLRDRTTGVTTLVSRPATPAVQADGPSHKPVISADGRYVVFSSSAKNLTGLWDGVTNAGVYRWDRTTGVTERVDVAPGGTPFEWSTGLVANSQDWWWTAISADGRYVAYSAPRAAGNSPVEALRRDMVTGEIVTASTGRAGSTSPATHVAMSADGSKVAFASTASLHDLTVYSGRHVYLRDMALATTTLVSAPDPSLAGAADSSDWPALDEDGSVVAFISSASNLVAAPLNAQPNVLVRDVPTGVTTLVSKGSLGAANHPCYNPGLSRDGRYVAFQTGADNLKVSGTVHPYYALYVVDRSTSVLTAIGQQTAAQPLDAWSSTVFTADSRYVAFSSQSGALVSGDTNSARDVFLFEYKYKKAPTLTQPRVSSYIRKYRSFYIVGTVSKHTGTRGKVQLVLKYKKRGWSTYHHYKTYTVYTPVDSSTYKKKLSVPYDCKWVVQAVHTECETYRSGNSPYRYFTVYR